MTHETSTITRTELDALDTVCHGIVTRDGWIDACNKPAVAAVYSPEKAGIWPACTWHSHRYGTGLMVTLAQQREARETGATVVTYDIEDDPA